MSEKHGTLTLLLGMLSGVLLIVSTGLFLLNLSTQTELNFRIKNENLQYKEFNCVNKHQGYWDSDNKLCIKNNRVIL